MEVGALTSVASRLFECAVLVGLGYNLKTAGLLKNSDGETAAKLGAFLTLPALILQHLAWSGRVSLVTATSLASAATFAAATGAFNWWYHDSRHKRERAVLAGSSVGSATALVGYPVVEAVWGGAGVQAAALADISCVPAELVASYLLVASAGPAFPQDYKHDDGGSYRGEWRGLKKEGLGTYTYPSDAKYEGEWRDNLKSGRGVYYFPAGGTYEGEWSGGSMHGVGVRTFSTGQVKAGRWEYNQLVEPMDVWQCSNAVEGATEAALAARRVEVGGGTPQDGLQQLLQYPPLWAILGGLVLNLLHLPLPHAVDSVTRVLAPANKPLMLLAYGLMLNIEKVQPRQVSDLCLVLGSRAVIPLFLAGTLLGACGARAPAATLPVLVALVAVLAPVSRSVQVYARRFRLNEPLAAALGNASQLVSPVVMACVALGAAALGAAPADPAVPFVPASGVPVAILLLLLAAALSVAVQQLYATHKPALNVKMVYKGLPTPAAGQTQPGAADATAATAGGTSDGGSPVPGGTSSSGSSNVDRSSPGSGEIMQREARSLQQLPPEVLQLICDKTPQADWVRASITCRALHEVQPLSLEVENGVDFAEILPWLRRHAAAVRKFTLYSTLQISHAVLRLYLTVPSALRAVEELYFWTQGGVDADALHLIAALTSLKRLTLNGIESFAEFSPCSNLETLHLEHCIWGELDLTYYPQLASLTVENCTASAIKLAPHSRCKVSVDGECFEQAIALAASCAGNVVRLDATFPDTALAAEQQQQLGSLSQLQTLGLRAYHKHGDSTALNSAIRALPGNVCALVINGGYQHGTYHVNLSNSQLQDVNLFVTGNLQLILPRTGKLLQLKCNCQGARAQMTLRVPQDAADAELLSRLQWLDIEAAEILVDNRTLQLLGKVCNKLVHGRNRLTLKQ